MKNAKKAQMIPERTAPAHAKLLSLVGDGSMSRSDMVAQWGEVDRDKLIWLVDSVARSDGAVLLGLSKDATQFHVKIYAGKGSKNYWFNGDPDGVLNLEEWIDAFAGALSGED